MQEIDLIHEVVTDQKSEDIGYQPSMDINQLNVAILLDRLDTYGSENFKIDKDEEFNDEWKVLTESREEYYKKASKVLLKDLKTGFVVSVFYQKKYSQALIFVNN